MPNDKPAESCALTLVAGAYQAAADVMPPDWGAAKAAILDLTPDDARAARDARDRRVRAETRKEVLKVRPLSWSEKQGDGVFEEIVYTAEAYTIERRKHAAVFDLRCELFWDGDEAIRFDSLEAAKAAAQADYERRVLNAIGQDVFHEPEDRG